MTRRIAPGSFLLVAATAGRALAAEPVPETTLDFALPMADARLIAAHGGGGGRVPVGANGPYVAIEGGWATMLGAAGDPTRGAPSFGGAVGYQFPTGLAFEVAVDDLGVDAPGGSGPIAAGGAGFRYTLPFLPVLPFLEAHLGAAVYGSNASFAADPGLGLAFPVVREAEIDVCAHDWMAAVDGEVRNVVVVDLGLRIGFSGG